ncbi:MAG: hypothetical protein A4E66_00419 [Syntrophus sp. PtaB.Bin001]|nr:MAG: hypothetical protein A4E66_00419 [Syntrophus sp. PtaB.Bin001]
MQGFLARRVEAFADDDQGLVPLKQPETPGGADGADGGADRGAGRNIPEFIGQGPDVIGRRPAAAAEEIDAGGSEGRAVDGESFCIHIEEGAFPFEPGKTGVGFGGQGNGGVGLHSLDKSEHGLWSGGTVAADGIGAETL